MKPALFIDFDGTLCHDRFWRGTESETYRKIQAFLFSSQSNTKLVTEWMLGEHTSEEINKLVAEALGLDQQTIWETFVSDCESMRIEKNTLEKISSLREKYTTILATDNMDCFSRFTVPALNLEKYFDAIVNSHYEKASKNDDGGKLFLDVLERHNVPISESVLIDNSKPTCDIFEKLGGTSLFVTTEKPLTFWLQTL